MFFWHYFYIRGLLLISVPIVLLNVSEIVEGGGESSAETTTKTEREGRSVGWLARYRHQKKTSADAVRNHDEQNHHHSSPISAHPQHR